jgi:hypothetical protein
MEVSARESALGGLSSHGWRFCYGFWNKGIFDWNICLPKINFCLKGFRFITTDGKAFDESLAKSFATSSCSYNIDNSHVFH